MAQRTVYCGVCWTAEPIEEGADPPDVCSNPKCAARRPQWFALAPTVVKQAPKKPMFTVNDRRFLRSLRIAYDEV